MDEPLSNLDAKLRASMRTEIKKLVTTLGITTIYVTHDQVEAMAMADRIAVMSQGDMVQIAAPLEIYDRPRTQFVADFIGSPAMNLFAATRRRDGGIDCVLKPFAAALPSTELARAGDLADSSGRLFVGIRPEHLTLGAPGDRGAVEALVEFVEPLGQTTKIYVNADGQRFVIVAVRVSARIGDAVGVLPGAVRLRIVALNLH
jgi:multiple sugar transport system ATP-binding protein